MLSRYGAAINLTQTDCRAIISPQSGQRVIGAASITHRYLILRAIKMDAIAHALELGTA